MSRRPRHVLDECESLRMPEQELHQLSRRFRAIFQQHCQARDRREDQAAHPPDLLAWGLTYLHDYFRLPPSTMHRWLAAELDALDGHECSPLAPRDERISRSERTTRTGRRGVKLNVLGPRGAAKSTLGTLAYPLRAAVEATEPYIWIVSDTRHQAYTHLANLKAELLANPRLANDYPQAAGRGPVWRSGAIVLRNGVAIEAFGTGQRIRGRRHREHRPTLIVCDDLQNDQHMESALQRDHSRRWFHGSLMKAGTKRTNVLNLATALHREALALELHRTPGWTSRIFQSIVKWPANMLLWEQWEAIYCDVDRPDSRDRAKAFFELHRAAMEAGAELLWPEEEDLYTLMSIRVESGRAAFEREKQNSPINPELCEWPESYFDERIWFDDWPRCLKIKTLALDPSKGGDARRGDYSAYVMLGIDERGVLFVEADLARRPTPQMVADGVALVRRFRPDAFGIEANQFQDLLADDFSQEFLRQGMFDVRPWTLDNRVNKLVRIRRLGPYLASGRIKFKSKSPPTRLLVNQLKDFPVGDHDDGPDALEMAIRLAAELLNPPEHETTTCAFRQ